MANNGFDLTGSTGSLSTPYVRPGVYRYNPQGGNGAFTPLYNVICTGVREGAGPDPQTAQFRYIQDDYYNINLGWPSRIEDIWPLDASGPYIVQSDDRIVVMGQNPDGSAIYYFDGFAQIPQCDVGPTSEVATFSAVGVAAREFDNPISGRTQRDADPAGIQDTSGNSDFQVDLPCRFNPSDTSYGDDGGFQANKTPANYDTALDEDTDQPAHPVFAQAGIQGRPVAQSAAYWSISDAIKYILAEYNARSQWTSYPALSTLDALLAVAYAAEDGPITTGDVQTDPLLIRDFDASNKTWPVAVSELLGYAGFLMRWDLESGTDGLPTTYLRIYRTDMMSQTPLKWLYWDDVGNSLADGSPNNLTVAHLARDANSIINAWQLETNQRQLEVSVYLAPLFQIAAGDATPLNSTTSGRNSFVKSCLDASNATAMKRRGYRWHGADEIGDGQWNSATGQWLTGQPLDLSTVFPPDEDEEDDTSTPSYVVRYRPADDHLISTDSQGRPLKVRLDISFDASVGPAGIQPGGTNFTWYNVPSGWRLLPDRLGIEVTVEDPEDWAIVGVGTDGKALKKINGISWWAAPPAEINGFTTGGFPPVLRLTCVIEDDLRMPISVGKRASSPTQFARWRVADGRDHFQYTSIDPGSATYPSMAPLIGGGALLGAGLGEDGLPPSTDPIVVRDDTEAATSHARALQRAHEMPPLAGSVTLPGVVTYYEVGDRISYISGRGIRLYQNAQSSGEIVTYATVVSREFSLDPNIYTTLHISDERAAPRMHSAVRRDQGGNAW